MKNKLLVSFSGGETSAFMAQWLWKNKQDEYDIIFVFANTGQENEETLEFVKKCSEYFGFPVIWVEAVVHLNKRKGATHKIVSFETASRDGKPFEEIIIKYGIPNMATPHCTREMKANPIRSYARSIGWKKYGLAIGIRADEIDRINPDRRDKKLIYPLITMVEMTKSKINFFWAQQPFRLNLKGYQGNCITCWKKHDPKLYQIAKENESAFLFFRRMEQQFENFIPASKLKVLAEKNKEISLPIRFFRKNRSVSDIINEAREWDGKVIDDSRVDENGIPLTIDLNGESCEVFSDCNS